jgi:hypothetical protein
MGTRGNYGFIYKEKLYVMHNQFDSYPERPGLGFDLVMELTFGNLDRWRRALDCIRVVTHADKPTEEDNKEALAASTDLQVSSRSTDDWYCLTRKNQGSMVRVLQSGYFYGKVLSVNKDGFSVDKYFYQDWGYLVNFDENLFLTFSWGSQVDEMSYPLDAIPDNLFSNEWIVAYNAEVEKKEKAKEDSKTTKMEADDTKGKLSGGENDAAAGPSVANPQNEKQDAVANDESEDKIAPSEGNDPNKKPKLG